MHVLTHIYRIVEKTMVWKSEKTKKIVILKDLLPATMSWFKKKTEIKF
jgi:hypothetical protein